MLQDITPILQSLRVRWNVHGAYFGEQLDRILGALTDGDEAHLYITYHFYIVITVILAKTVLHWKIACAILTVECRLSICLRVMHVNSLLMVHQAM